MDLEKLHLHWRSCKRDNIEYKSYSLAKSYRSDGKNRKEIVLKLGKLNDEEVLRWKTALKSAKCKTSTSIDVKNFSIISNISYLDVVVILQAWNFWELDLVFNSKDTNKQRSVQLSSLVFILIANRCLNPSSKSRVSTWVKQTTIPFLLDISLNEINSSRIFRELFFIENCKDELSKHLCEKMLKLFPEEMKSIFYDLSTTTFTTDRCVLVSWGHCKEGYDNHIVLALVVNAKGFPIYWEVLEGGTADVTTIPWLLDRLRQKLSIITPTIVFDRGMVSEKNLNLLEKNKVTYITAMDKNQIVKFVGDFNFTEFQIMDENNIDMLINNHSDFIKIDDSTYGKDINLINDRRYILCFNTQLFKDQKKARSKQVIEFEKFVDEQNVELLKAKKNRSALATQKRFTTALQKGHLKNFIEIRLETKKLLKNTKTPGKYIRTYQAKIHTDKIKEMEVGKLDGFWLLVTNLSQKIGDNFIKDTESVVQPYREKVIIESSFRDIKSFIDISPVHVWKEKHVKAHYTICVLSHLLDRTLSWFLHKNIGDKTKDIVSHVRLYEELSGCRLNQIDLGHHQKIYKLTEATDRQKELLTRLDMEYLIEEASVQTLTSTALKRVKSK